jgi:hypothetical protein
MLDPKLHTLNPYQPYQVFPGQYFLSIKSGVPGPYPLSIEA